MTPIESQALAEVLLWLIGLILVIFGIDWIYGRIYDGMPLTPEEQAQREARRIAQQATKEFKRRQRLRSVRFWNF